MTCVIHAHFINIARPGTYAAELNRMLTANGLPPVKLGLEELNPSNLFERPCRAFRKKGTKRCNRLWRTVTPEGKKEKKQIVSTHVGQEIALRWRKEGGVFQK